MSVGDGEAAPYAEKFNIMLKVFAAPDGGGWTGTKMERATRGAVITSYFSSLRDGHIKIPRADKLEQISEAMGFPVQLWFKDLAWWRDIYERWERGETVSQELSGEERRGLGNDLGVRLNRLIESRPSGETGRAYTDEEISRRSTGMLSREEVAALRRDSGMEPTWRQILALCEVFDVDPSYWSGGGLPWRPSPALMRAVEDQESYAIFQNSLGLSRRDRTMLRVMSEHLRRETDE